MKSYKDLEIYRISYGLAVQVHTISLTLPKYELYEEGSQVRRSSKGITSWIVEGYGRRRYKPDFVKYLTYAPASCDETILHLNFIHDAHREMKPEGIAALLEAYDLLGGKINNFIQYVDEEWTTPVATTQEH